VLDNNGQPVSGVAVAFSSTGPVIVDPASAVTNSAGRAQTSVRAGGFAASATVTATAGSFTTRFNLTVRPRGPQVDPANVVNLITGENGVTGGGLAVITGQNIAAGVQGTVDGSGVIGVLPTTLAGVSVTFASTPAPILSVSNSGGVESVVVQVPFEISGAQSVPMVLSANGQTTTITVPVRSYQPGLFETTDAQGRTYALAVRPDGTTVSPENPARRGETIRVYAIGLGRTNPVIGTNRIGVPGLTVAAPVVVGLNDQSVRVVSAEYAPNMIGLYAVAFEVPQNTATGSTRGLVVAVSEGGNLIFSNGSTIAVQ